MDAVQDNVASSSVMFHNVGEQVHPTSPIVFSEGKYMDVRLLLLDHFEVKDEAELEKLGKAEIEDDTSVSCYTLGTAENRNQLTCLK